MSRAPAAHVPARPQRRRRLRAALLGLAFLGVAAWFGGLALAARQPAWWRDLGPAADAAHDHAHDHDAERLEHDAVTAVHRARIPGERWTLVIHEEAANAWLAQRLPKWVANARRPGDEPAALPTIRVRFSEGVVRVGADVGGRVAWIRCAPEVVAPGAVALRNPGAGIGAAPLPLRWVADRAAESRAQANAPDAARRALAALAAGEVFDGAALRLEDGREVRLLGARVTPGALELECETR